MEKYEVHVHSKALNKLFQQFPQPQPGCLGRIVAAFCLMQNTCPDVKKFSTQAIYKPSEEQLVFPMPVLTHGPSRQSTRDLAIIQALQTEQIWPSEQALAAQHEIKNKLGIYDGVPWVHFVEFKPWNQQQFLKWAEPKGAQPQDFVCFVFKNETSRVTPLACVHEIKTDEPITDALLLEHILLPHIRECLEQSGKPPPTAHELAVQAHIDPTQTKPESIVEDFKKAAEVDSWFDSVGTHLLQTYHPFFSNLRYGDDGQPKLPKKHFLTLEKNSSIKKQLDAFLICKDPRQTFPKLERFAKDKTAALRQRYRETFGLDSVWGGLDKWPLRAKLAALMLPPKPDVPNSVSFPVLQQDYVCFGLATFPARAWFSLDGETKEEGTTRVLRVSLEDNAVRDYYENQYWPARCQLEEGKEMPDMNLTDKYTRLRGNELVIKGFLEQDLFLSHLSHSTLVPKKDIVGALEVHTDSGPDD